MTAAAHQDTADGAESTHIYAFNGTANEAYPSERPRARHCPGMKRHSHLFQKVECLQNTRAKLSVKKVVKGGLGKMMAHLETPCMFELVRMDKQRFFAVLLLDFGIRGSNR